MVDLTAPGVLLGLLRRAVPEAPEGLLLRSALKVPGAQRDLSALLVLHHPADLGGRRVQGGPSVRGLLGVQRALGGQPDWKWRKGQA